MNGDTEMNARIGGGRSLLAAVAVVVGLLALGTSSAGAMTMSTVYNNIVTPLPGNYASIGFAATSTSEYGGQVELAGAARKSPKITVAMSAWACQQGNWSENTCATPKPRKKFKWPVTLNVYSVGPGNSVGMKLGSMTKTFAMPYRPSVSAECTSLGDPGAWLDAAAPGMGVEKCFHGLAFTLTFAHLGLGKTALPSNVIVSLAYNTTAHGPAPVGTQPCGSKPEGCYYDALNFAVVEPAEKALSVGSDLTESQYVNSGWNEMYCGSSASLNTFAASGVCPAWYEGDQPTIKVEASS
jgi:hypothetical protein